VVVLIDPAHWPAHGTVFSHLVSDSSLAELHAFAERAGLSARAFDRDHYDVPLARREELIALGAQPVSGTELVRRLRASGLRVTSRERPEHAAFVLRRRWPETLADGASVRDELLERWSEPHRSYHDVTHLLAVLDALVLVAGRGSVPLVVELAAWFHDAVYDGAAGSDEERSAALAERLLGPLLAEQQVAEVGRLVRLTAGHQPREGDQQGALLCDADLAVLGGEPARYDRYVAAVRQDYAHVSDEDWRRGRAAVLRRLLTLDPLYRTERGQALWLERAHENLNRELAALTS
jgi:predicted metal-dependent HD superfamily phosphohydrolase